MANSNPATAPSRELSSIDFGSMIGGPLIAVVEAQAKAAMSTVDYIKSVGFEEDEEGNSKPVYVSFTYPKEISPYIPAKEGIVSIKIKNQGSGYTSTPDSQTVSIGGIDVEVSVKMDNGSIISASIENKEDPSNITKSSSENVEFSNSNGTAAIIEVSTVKPMDAKDANFQDMEMKVPILTMLPTPFIRIDEATVDFNAKINSLEEANFESKSKFKSKIDAEANYGNDFSPYKVGVKLKASMSHQKTSSGGYNVQREYTMNVHVRAVNDEMPAGMERLLGILEENIKATPISTKMNES